MARSRSRKKSNTRSPNQELFIFCNGEQTEKNYIEAILYEKRLPAARIKVIPSEYNRFSLVRQVEQYLKDEKVDKGTKVWLVFDVDAEIMDNPDVIKQQVDNAQNSCEKHKFQYAISNDSFEYWLLCHFQYCDSHLSRDVLMEKLSKLLNKKYKKDEEIYESIKDKIEMALKNARKIANTYEQNARISCCCPYTGMHKLLDCLNRLEKKEDCLFCPNTAGCRSAKS